MSLTRDHPTRQRGFTLVEVLVALAIFSLCATVLSAQSTTTLNNRQRLIEQQIALWVAKDTLVEQRISSAATTTLVNGQQNKKQAGREWRIDLTVEPTSNGQLKKVRVQVSVADERNRQDHHAAQLTTFIEQ